MESCLKIGGEYRHGLGTKWVKSVLYHEPQHKTQPQHNNQHEPPPPYPPAAFALSLHDNICHGPKSWCCCSLWAHTRLTALIALSPLLVPLFEAPKCNPSKNIERGGVSALGCCRLSIRRNNQPKVHDHGRGGIWEGGRPGRNVWG